MPQTWTVRRCARTGAWSASHAGLTATGESEQDLRDRLRELYGGGGSAHVKLRRQWIVTARDSQSGAELEPGRPAPAAVEEQEFGCACGFCGSRVGRDDGPYPTWRG